MCPVALNGSTDLLIRLCVGQFKQGLSSSRPGGLDADFYFFTFWHSAHPIFSLVLPSIIESLCLSAISLVFPSTPFVFYPFGSVLPLVPAPHSLTQINREGCISLHQHQHKHLIARQYWDSRTTDCFFLPAIAKAQITRCEHAPKHINKEHIYTFLNSLGYKKRNQTSLNKPPSFF